MLKSKKLLIILGKGGHTEQMLKLINDFKNDYQFEYVISKDDKVSAYKIKIPGKVFRMFNPRKMSDKSPFIVALKMIPAFFDAFKIVSKTKAKCIISCGPGMAIPIILAGKLFGKKIIFIESWSRIYSKSLSGKISYHLSDLFFIQWEELKKKYPKAIYAGRLS